jgi:hypothetical protein
MLRQSSVGYQPPLDNPKAEVCSKSFYTHLTVVEHFETDAVSKKVVHSSFHTQEITQGTGEWIAFESLLRAPHQARCRRLASPLTITAKGLGLASQLLTGSNSNLLEIAAKKWLAENACRTN